jgi:membrane-associated phospholipid phosphatase
MTRFHPALALLASGLALVCLLDTPSLSGAQTADSVKSNAEALNPCSLMDTLIFDGWDMCKITVRMASAPFHARRRELLEALGLVGAVALSSTLDNSVRDATKELDKPWANRVSDVGRFYQDKYVTLGAAGVFYAYGTLRGKREIRRIGVEILEAFEIGGAGSGLLKSLVGRDRPFVEHGHLHFVGPNRKDTHQSFISGDAMKAFALSSVLSAEAKSLPVAIVLYGLATTTAFQRLHKDRHWFSDTMGSAVWSSAVGWGVVYLNHRKDQESGKPSSGHPRIHVTFTNLADSAPGIGLAIEL